MLVALADPFQLELVTEACESAGCQVVTAANGEDALNALARRPPALVLAGADLERTNGHEIAKILAEDSKLDRIPLILLGARDEPLADVTLPARPRVDRLQAAVRRSLAEARAERRRWRASEYPMSVGDDPETGAGSRAQLLLSLSYEITEAERTSRPLACVVVRAAPLRVVGIARRALQTLRASDLVFRPSPEELTWLLPETDEAGLDVVLARLEGDLEGAAVGSAIIPRPGVSDPLKTARERIGFASR